MYLRGMIYADKSTKLPFLPTKGNIQAQGKIRIWQSRRTGEEERHFLQSVVFGGDSSPYIQDLRAPCRQGCILIYFASGRLSQRYTYQMSIVYSYKAGITDRERVAYE